MIIPLFVDNPTIRNWWNDDPYNIGLRLTDKRLIVFDIDVKHGSGVNGLDSYKKLISERHYEPLPSDSYIERTPKGGLHWFLSYPEGTPIKNIQGAFFHGSGIDLITNGVPVYPSTIVGNEYTPLENKTLLDVKPAPQWVLDEFRPTRTNFSVTSSSIRTKKYTGKLLDEIVSGSEKGSRNAYLTRLAGKMFAVGADAKTIYNLLLVTNDNFLDERLPEKEVNTIFSSILKRETGRLNAS
ncbi:bifunctional DNA primase/polymerase [Loigolactobacillus backii]|uniref:bifunctional DNA primase/polymerase n=1 Tax=Loigolactobacillus backii TaxID=375175 RepID=UPI0022FD5548|nr:bifunctional DNA primase/polymerase [Loigolactobacillus backii]MDA5388581.1 bifunctional DNA primase/polymerase [Loigolactobacillus backii]MDA5391035.1 bifunctional DNA primase/polymerase [Loigolactobacillus backii]